MNPMTQALRRIGVASQMSLRFAVLPEIAAADELHRVLSAGPHWILLQSGDEPDTVIPATDLVRYLEEFPDIDQVDLTSIPAKRASIVGIHKRASLLEAEELMRSQGVDILYVYDMPAPAMRRVKGVIERSIIESSYRFQ
jgi:CIC family chloride channel protein